MSSHILIVEDDVMIQGFLTLTLENEGYRISAVGSGSGLFSVLAQQSVDLVLLDLGLPDSDGLDVLREIRRQYTIPVIVATARRRSEDREAAIELGANDYVTKPFEPRELVERVKQQLQGGGTAAPSRRKRDRRKGNDVHDVVLNLAPQPEPTAASAPASAPPIAAIPAGSVAKKSDIMVMLIGVVVVVASLMGGGFWYMKYLDDDAVVPEVTSQKTPVNTAEQTPQQATKPAVQQSVIAPRPTEPEPVKSAPTPRTLTESVVVPSTNSDIDDKKDVLALAPSEPMNESIEPVSTVCPPVPDVEWWRVKTHDQIKRYVLRKHGGAWEPYIDSWAKRLTKLQDIYQRGKAVQAGRGVILQDAELAVYVNQVAERVAVTKCLAEQAETLSQ
jgi:CheY-like chemotaxis protein